MADDKTKRTENIKDVAKILSNKIDESIKATQKNKDKNLTLITVKKNMDITINYDELSKKEEINKKDIQNFQAFLHSAEGHIKEASPEIKDMIGSAKKMMNAYLAKDSQAAEKAHKEFKIKTTHDSQYLNQTQIKDPIKKPLQSQSKQAYLERLLSSKDAAKQIGEQLRSSAKQVKDQVINIGKQVVKAVKSDRSR